MTLAKRHPKRPGNLKVLHLPGESERMRKEALKKKFKDSNFPW